MKYFYIVCCMCVLVACSTTGEQDVPATKLFNTAMEYMADDNTTLAKQNFEQFVVRYPWDARAEYAQLELIRMHIDAGNYTQAFGLIDEVESLYPNSIYKDYLLFARGYAHYLDNKATLEDYTYTDISQRGVSSARRAFDIFTQLILVYPNSQYAPNARQRMIYLRNLFADKEVDIARFYSARGAYLACIERVSVVLKEYISTPAVPQAVALFKQCAQQAHVPSLAAEADALEQQLAQ